uniref:Preprotein-translocase subunit g n=1 Tax=Chondria sp. (in: red algae) TaxID=1982705 RepID=A0A1Z1MDY1_9FLOR|nr:preprotein-translocase subunit g [Chondria sp. (in: red algae)]
MKIFFYIFSLLTIILILMTTPGRNNSTSLNYQNKLFNLKSSQLFIQRLIVLSVFMFFFLIVLSLL